MRRLSGDGGRGRGVQASNRGALPSQVRHSSSFPAHITSHIAAWLKLCLVLECAHPRACRGSVAKAEIVAAIYQQMGRKVSEDDLSLPEIKTLGLHEVTLRLHPEVVGTFQVNIQREKEVQAKGKKK